MTLLFDTIQIHKKNIHKPPLSSFLAQRYNLSPKQNDSKTVNHILNELNVYWHENIGLLRAAERKFFVFFFLCASKVKAKMFIEFNVLKSTPVYYTKGIFMTRLVHRLCVMMTFSFSFFFQIHSMFYDVCI